MMQRVNRYSLVLVMLLLTVSAYSATFENGKDALVAVFWYDGTLFFAPNRYLMSEGGYGTVSSKDFQELNGRDKEAVEAIANLLEEARLVFSGIIYGWRFFYQPSDRLRNVKEVFRLEPIAQIQTGDRNLEPLSSEQKGTSLVRLRVRYHLGAKDAQHIAFRSSPSLLFSTGKGSAGMESNFAARKEAIENSVKEAIRSHQRKRMHAKPQSLSGVVYLEEPPRVYLNSGQFIADSKVLFLLMATKKYFLP